MNILICIKQVPQSENVKIDPVKGTLNRTSTQGVINPEDLTALEAALAIKDKQGANVTVLSMGPAPAKTALYEALSMGADKAVLLCDRAFAGADTYATALILAAAIRRMGGFDLILCGRQTTDGETGQVGPLLAQRLDVPQVTFAKRILEINQTHIMLERMLDDEMQTVCAELPALVTVSKELGEPRFPTVRGIVEAFEKTVTVWSGMDIGLDDAFCALTCSPTQFRSMAQPTVKKAGQRMEGTADQAVNELFVRLREKRVW